MVTCMRQRHSEASCWNVFSTPARTRSCLFILALIGIALSVPQEQVHGQIPFGKVPLQAEKPLEQLPPNLAEELLVDIVDIEDGELVGRYVVIQVKYWFLWEDCWKAHDDPWGYPPSGSWDRERYSDEGWETVCESEFLPDDPDDPSWMAGLASYLAAHQGMAEIHYLMNGYPPHSGPSGFSLPHHPRARPLRRFVRDWYYGEFRLLKPYLKHASVRFIEVEIYRDSDGNLHKLETVDWAA